MTTTTMEADGGLMGTACDCWVCVEYSAASCPTCGGTGRVPDPKLPYTRNIPCPDCTKDTP